MKTVCEFLQKLVIRIILIVIVVGILVNFDKYDAANGSKYPVISITEITENEYEGAVELYMENPIHNGVRKTITVPSENNLLYYRFDMLESGFSDDTPIEIAIYFATEENNAIVKNSSFTITPPKDLSSKQLRYLNTIIGVVNMSKKNEILVTLGINTVYNDKKTYTFDYQSNTVIDLCSLEVISYSSQYEPTR